jgi:predicted MFS family arabinose efflux permease
LTGSREIFWLACASAIVTANAYYIHPIIAAVARDFGVSNADIGIVPAVNQIALALGVLLLLPLGDRVDNRKLVTLCLSAQVLTLVVMAVTTSFVVFITASTALGFFTITPYLLPAYASRRVTPQQLGYATALLTTGVIAGVQISRLSAGVIGAYTDWRWVYWIAAALMATAAIVVPRIMVPEPVKTHSSSYWALIRSLFILGKEHPRLMVSGVIQGLNFAAFIAVWLGIGLHLTSDTQGHGSDLVGYLTAFSAIGLLTTARLGKWADAQGAEKARLIMATFQFLGITLLMTAESNWMFLLPPLALMAVVGPLVDVTGRMTGLQETPAVRTRLMSLYVCMMFTGGGLGSWAGTLAYDRFAWTGIVGLTMSLSATVWLLSLQQWYQRSHRQAA